MIEVSKYKCRNELVEDLRPLLPFYVVTSNEIFKAYEISNNYYRDNPGIEMYVIKTQQLQKQWNKHTRQLKISSGQIITKTLEEAQGVLIHKKALMIKSQFPEIEQKYIEYSKFIDEHPEEFI